MLNVYLEMAAKQDAEKRAYDEQVDLYSRLPKEELLDIAMGTSKLAYCDDGEWLEKFEGTDLYEQALMLQKQMLDVDIAQKQEELEREMNPEPPRGDFYKQRDTIRLQQRLLELELNKKKLVENTPAAGSVTNTPELPVEAAPAEGDKMAAFGAYLIQEGVKEALTRTGKGSADILAEHEAAGRSFGGTTGATLGALAGSAGGMLRARTPEGLIGRGLVGASLGGIGGGLVGSALGGHVGRNAGAVDVTSIAKGQATPELLDEQDAAGDAVAQAGAGALKGIRRGALAGSALGMLGGAALGGPASVLPMGLAGALAGSSVGGTIGRRSDDPKKLKAALVRAQSAEDALEAHAAKKQASLKEANLAAVGAAMKGLGAFGAQAGKSIATAAKTRGIKGAVDTAGAAARVGARGAGEFAMKNPGLAAGMGAGALGGAALAGRASG